MITFTKSIISNLVFQKLNYAYYYEPINVEYEEQSQIKVKLKTLLIEEVPYS